MGLCPEGSVSRERSRLMPSFFFFFSEDESTQERPLPVGTTRGHLQGVSADTYC